MAISTCIKSGLLTIILLSAGLHGMAQKADSITAVEKDGQINKARLTGLVIGGSLAYAGTMFGLYQMWYKDFPQTSFHFINDNHEWLQLDKGGHAFNAYYMGMIGYESLRWAGVDKRKSAIYGGGMGFFYLTVIEILDGFSAEWGASGGDLIANTVGSATFISQQLLWEEQRIQIKWSVHMTGYQQYRPDQLGHSFVERMIKDYNGQTFWLSANIHSFLKKDSRFPKWLNVAAGYGGEGMTGGLSNPAENEDGVPLPSFDRYRKFYVAPDINLSKIRTNSRTLNVCLKYLSIFKFPMPALEFSKKGVKVHGLYF
ncbi:MAG: DUF2279 domain-containing protein [Bacteroidales bacterium]|nr:DUF2279 domain-containing protein [Bacteroidales bacterium]